MLVDSQREDILPRQGDEVHEPRILLSGMKSFRTQMKVARKINVWEWMGERSATQMLKGSRIGHPATVAHDIVFGNYSIALRHLSLPPQQGQQELCSH